MAIVLTFLLYFLAIFFIGCFAYRRIKTVSDYVLGGRSLTGPLAAMAVGASDMSSWLMMSLPGLVYLYGLSQAWVAVGLLLGSWINWHLIAKRLRIYTEITQDALTIPSYLSRRFRDPGRIRFLSAIVFIIFFTFYAASGLVAGAQLLGTTFGLSYQVSLYLTVAIIVPYTILGGFLAISWIDLLQGALILFALLLIPCTTLSNLGGLQEAWMLANTKPTLLDWWHNISIIELTSLLTWGLGYFGQPHILVRFMAIRHPQDIALARQICLVWMTLALGGAVALGLAANLYLSTQQVYHENVFFVLAQELFNPWITGILLAGVLSAIMSTISALLIACSSALTEDIYHYLRPQTSSQHLIWGSRLVVLCVAIMALLIALQPENSVFSLVEYAWSGLGATFGPVILFSLYYRQTTTKAVFCGLFCGALTVTVWPYLHFLGGIFQLYALLPGFLINCSVIACISRLDTSYQHSILLDEFDVMLERATSCNTTEVLTTRR